MIPPSSLRLATPLLALLGALPAAELANVSRFSVVELTFTGPTLGAAQNPVAGVDFWVEFRHESGAPTYRVHGFWDADGGSGTSGNLWRVRFAPTTSGRWIISDTYSNRSELNDAKEGDHVTATTASASPGFWLVDADSAGKRWFKRSDGSHPFLVGNTFYDFLSRPSGTEATSTTIRDDIAACAGYFTKVRFCLVSPRDANASQTVTACLTTSGAPTQSVTSVPNPRFFRERVDAAVKKGFETDLACDLILGGTMYTQTVGNAGFHKYVAARYGAYANVWFTVGQEWDEQDDAAGQKAKANQLKGYLPYPNPITTHGLSNWNSDLNSAVWTHSASQGKKYTIATSADFMAIDRANNGGKPAINDENGYDPGEATSNGVLQGILGSFAAGGYGTTGNKTGDKAGGYVWGHAAMGTTLATAHPSAPGLKYLRETIDGHLQYWKMAPAGQPSSSIFSGGSTAHRVLQESGRQYALASNSAANYTAALPAGSWKVVRVDLVARSETVLATAASGSYAFGTPSSVAALTLFISTGGATNAAPQVQAGDDVTIAWPTASASLSGSASDDGLPSGSTLSQQWSKVSGPGTATFSAATAAQTSVTVSEAGTYVLRLTASDGALSGSDELSLVVTGGDRQPTVRTVSGDLNPATVGAAYADDLEADGGDAPLSWSHVAGTLPPGISVSGSELSGTPTTAGTYAFTVRVTDADGDTDDQELSLTVQAAGAVRVNFQPAGVTVPSGYLADTGAVFADRGNGRSYGWNVANTANTRERNVDADQRLDTLNHLQKSAGMVWELALANGSYEVEVGCGDPSYTDSVNSLAIEGVVAADPDGQDRFDTHTVSVSVSDGRLTIAPGAGGVNAKLCYLIATPVSADSAPAITTTGLAGGTVGTAYNAGLAASGGDGTLTWEITAGSLPAGLSLSGATISGTPTSAGTASFTVRVTDADGDTDTQDLAIAAQAASGAPVVSGLWTASGRTYTVDSALAAQDRLYIDRTFVFTGVGSLAGATHIITANGDKALTQSAFLRFTVDRAVVVHLLYDARAGTLPAGFSGWTATGEVLTTGDTGRRVWTREFVAGAIELPGNLAGGGTGAGSMYGVAITAVPSGNG